MNSFTKDFIREKICFYSPILGIKNFTDLIKLGGEYGVHGIEFLNYGEMATPDLAAARELKKLAKERDLAFPCFSVGIDLVGEHRAENIVKLKKYADICADLEIPYLHHTVAGRFAGGYKPGEIEQYFSEGVEATCEIAEYANKLGVKTLLEDQGFVVNGVEGYGKFRAAANNCFDTLVDTGNIYFADETAGAFAEAFAFCTRHTHVKDYYITKEEPVGVRSYLSKDGNYISCAVANDGDVDYDRVKAALKKAGYNGLYSVEYVLDKREDLDRTLEYLAAEFGDM
jgi:sugar phosphate isomerase/epimerase